MGECRGRALWPCPAASGRFVLSATLAVEQGSRCGWWTEQGQGGRSVLGIWDAQPGGQCGAHTPPPHLRAGRASVVGPSLCCCVPPARLLPGAAQGGPVLGWCPRWSPLHPACSRVVCRERFEVCPGHCPAADSRLSHVLTSPCRLVDVPVSPAVPLAAGQAGPGVLSALAAGRGLLVALAKQARPGPVLGFSALTPVPACPRDPHHPRFRRADQEPTAQAHGLWLCRADSHGASRARPSPASPAAQAQARLCLPASVLQQRDACSPCPKRTSSRDECPVRRQPLTATPPPQPCSTAPAGALTALTLGASSCGGRAF